MIVRIDERNDNVLEVGLIGSRSAIDMARRRLGCRRVVTAAAILERSAIRIAKANDDKVPLSASVRSRISQM